MSHQTAAIASSSERESVPGTNRLDDTNVFIDRLGRKQPFFEEVRNIIAAGFFGDTKLWVPAQLATDALYALNRYVASDKLRDAAQQALEVIEPVSLVADDLRREDYENRLAALAADKVRTDYLITRDTHGFDRPPIPTLSRELA